MQVRSLLAAAALTVAACGRSGTAPVDPPPADVAPATYVLVSANDHPLPALVHDTTWTETNERTQLFAHADTIVLSADGRYTQSALLHGYNNGISIGPTLRRDRGVVTREGAALHFESDYLQHVAFDGVVDANGRLTVVQDLPREGSTAQYVLHRQ